MFLMVIWDFLKTLADIFKEPELRVRAVNMKTGKYVYGTVKKTTQEQRRYAPEPFTYWTVVWDDAPGVWKTVLSAKFVWYDGYHTLIER